MISMNIDFRVRYMMMYVVVGAVEILVARVDNFCIYCTVLFVDGLLISFLYVHVDICVDFFAILVLKDVWFVCSAMFVDCLRLSGVGDNVYIYALRSSSFFYDGDSTSLWFALCRSPYFCMSLLMITSSWVSSFAVAL